MFPGTGSAWPSANHHPGGWWSGECERPARRWQPVSVFLLADQPVHGANVTRPAKG
jgi:hypothetical protein